VLAQAHEDKRMTLRAVVHLRDGIEAGDSSDALIRAFVKERLQPFKYPRIIEYRESLPKTGTGKIDRRALVQPQ
jgi:acyl-coenzyme A synthetase/AMP-(fatty) acid ligase